MIQQSKTQLQNHTDKETKSKNKSEGIPNAEDKHAVSVEKKKIKQKGTPKRLMKFRRRKQTRFDKEWLES